MSESIVLRITGEVEKPIDLRWDELASIPPAHQIDDVSRVVPGRRGSAVRLAGILDLVQPKPRAKYLGVHSSTDNFHASIPLDAVREQAFIIYRQENEPLSPKNGGPFRFLIPDHTACHTSEIDECANVKFVDHLEFTQTRGFDNRPTDEQEHAKLHANDR